MGKGSRETNKQHLPTGHTQGNSEISHGKCISQKVAELECGLDLESCPSILPYSLISSACAITDGTKETDRMDDTEDP